MQGYGLVVRHIVRRGHEESFDQLVNDVVEHITRHEPETLVYISHSVPGDPAVRIFYELYRDQAAFEFHERQEYVLGFLAAREEHIESVAVEFVTALNGRA